MLTTQELPERGAMITIAYPTKNRHGKSPRLERRTVRVIQVEDGAEVPIPIDCFLNRPKVRRGRWRIIAWDAESWGMRQFYPDWSEPCPLQIGHFNLETGKLDRLIGRPYSQTPADIKELVGTCRELLKTPLSSNDRKTLAIFAAEAA